MSRDDIQRMLGGSERDSSEVLSEAANKALGDRTPTLTQEADAALELVDNLSAVLHDNIDPTATAAQTSDATRKTNDQEINNSASSSSSSTRSAQKAEEADVATASPAAKACVTTVLPDFSQRVGHCARRRGTLLALTLNLVAFC